MAILTTPITRRKFVVRSAAAGAGPTVESAPGGNSFVMSAVSMATDMNDPIARVERIMATTTKLKSQGAHSMPQMMDLAQSMPGNLAGTVQRALVRMVNRTGRSLGVHTIVTNVPGPQMPLYLAGCEVASEASLWKSLAEEIAEFALARFFDKNGMLHEFFDTDWKFAPDLPGRIVEPGHQYEWAWLLLRWAGDKHPKARATALKLIEVTEANCIRDGLALQQVLDDFSPHDASARLWPQTERLKAAALAARLTGDARYLGIAVAACEGILRYLETPIPGLWYARIDASGKLIDEPAPASTFYHLVVAVAELSALARLN